MKEAFFAPDIKVSSQCLTPESSKIDCKQAHYTTLSIKLLENWIPVSGHWYDTFQMEITPKLLCLYVTH
ncbi:hypothetical protein [Candidatus Wolbachia massiliensis]|uniref:Uncharacterized protein n=1 Tax=Candidatus Wolbachia massiliensis TaxID=1845000 RepID=A0A7L7YM71_9RICK|nr:hypothetical protein [Candidatus Wolbachia massiliensis]QOD38158.1 hypothetical protein ID128_05125 [Candidatus Wolbachia massiliensis]